MKIENMSEYQKPEVLINANVRNWKLISFPLKEWFLLLLFIIIFFYIGMINWKFQCGNIFLVSMGDGMAEIKSEAGGH